MYVIEIIFFNKYNDIALCKYSYFHIIKFCYNYKYRGRMECFRKAKL